MSVNSSMAVAGYYTTSPSTAAGFVRNADGTLTTFSIEGGLWTVPESINDSGDVTGFYEVVADVPQGFIRYANGRIVKFDILPTGQSGPQAQPIAINAFGDVAGGYYPYPAFQLNGFTRSRAGVTSSFGFANYTFVTGLNANGTVVGYVANDSSYRYGYFINPDGFFTNFDVPVSTGGFPVGNEITIPEGINAEGTIAGFYTACFNRCGMTASGGFIRSSQGAFTLFTAPGSIMTPKQANEFADQPLQAPHVLSINDAGTIAGSYTDASGAQHGFVRNPAGTITAFDPPRGMQTAATSINNTGVIVGSFYYDWSPQTSIGFLRIPTQ